MDWFIALTQILNRILGWIDSASQKKATQERQSRSRDIDRDPVGEFVSMFNPDSKTGGTTATKADIRKHVDE